MGTDGDDFVTAVSILVFLDSPLRPSGAETVAIGLRGFNPCFSGFTFETAGGSRVPLLPRFVSILVFLDSPLRLKNLINTFITDIYAYVSPSQDRHKTRL